MENKTSPNHENGNDANRLLSAVASLDEIEGIAVEYFENKYPLMDFENNPSDKEEIDWVDMLSFVRHVLSCHCR